MEMQYELLSYRFADDSNTNASAVNLIKNMADGTLAHHAGALKFGLREGFSRTTRAASATVPAPTYEHRLPAKNKKGHWGAR
jgi:hypothetical protein